MQDMELVEALKVVAIQKAIKAAKGKTARDVLPVGKHDVSFLARVTGSLTVGKDELYTPTAELPIQATLALFVRYCGITRDAAMRAMTRAMTESLADGETGADKTATMLSVLESEDVIRASWKTVLDALSTLPDKKRRGKVTTKLEVALV